MTRCFKSQESGKRETLSGKAEYVYLELLLSKQ